MLYRLIAIPFIVIIFIVIGIFIIKAIVLPSPPNQSGLEKLIFLENTSSDFDFKWNKAKEIIEAESNVSNTQNKVINSGIDLMFFTLLVILGLTIVQLGVTLKIWLALINKLRSCEEGTTI